MVVKLCLTDNTAEIFSKILQTKIAKMENKKYHLLQILRLKEQVQCIVKKNT